MREVRRGGIEACHHQPWASLELGPSGRTSATRLGHGTGSRGRCLLCSQEHDGTTTEPPLPSPAGRRVHRVLRTTVAWPPTFSTRPSRPAYASRREKPGAEVAIRRSTSNCLAMTCTCRGSTARQGCSAREVCRGPPRLVKWPRRSHSHFSSWGMDPRFGPHQPAPLANRTARYVTAATTQPPPCPTHLEVLLSPAWQVGHGLHQRGAVLEQGALRHAPHDHLHRVQARLRGACAC